MCFCLGYKICFFTFCFLNNFRHAQSTPLLSFDRSGVLVFSSYIKRLLCRRATHRAQRGDACQHRKEIQHDTAANHETE
jgi:hypothetical protein